MKKKARKRHDLQHKKSNDDYTKDVGIEKFPDCENLQIHGNTSVSTDDIKDNSNNSIPVTESCGFYINENVRNKLKKIIKEHPEGIWCSDLPKYYLKHYHYALDYKEFGCTSLIHFLSQMPDIITCVRPGQGDWILYDVSLSEIQSESKISNTLLSTPCSSCADSDLNNVCLENCSGEIVHFDDKLVNIDLKLLDIVNTHLKISGGEVYAPDKFYIHLKKSSEYLEKFMSDLQDFYNAHFAEYKIPDSALRKYQICVAYYSPDCTLKEEWHRAQILQVLSNKSVSVYLVDFGTICTLRKTHLRYLHNAFMRFPVQAIPAKLYGVVPSKENVKWPAKTCALFFKFLQKSTLEAVVIKIEENKSSSVEICELKNYLSLILHDSAEPERPSLNKQLLDDIEAQVGGDVFLVKDKSYHIILKEGDANPVVEALTEEEQPKANKLEFSPEGEYHENIGNEKILNAICHNDVTSEYDQRTNSHSEKTSNSAKNSSNLDFGVSSDVERKVMWLNRSDSSEKCYVHNNSQRWKNLSTWDLILNNEDLRQVAALDPSLALRLAQQMFVNMGSSTNLTNSKDSLTC